MALGIHSPTVWFGKVAWDKDIKIKKSLKTQLLIYIELIGKNWYGLPRPDYACIFLNNLFIKALIQAIPRKAQPCSSNTIFHIKLIWKFT